MTRRDVPIVAAVSTGVFLWILDALVVTIALADIRRDLGTDAAGLQWVIDAYAVVFASLMLAGGTIADRFGARRVYVAGLAALAVASAACAAAPGIAALAVARAMQGAAAAALLPSSLSLLRQAYPDNARRATAIGVWSAVSGLAGVIGPLLAGVLIATGGWRLTFVLMVPLCLLGIALALRVLGETAGSPSARLDGEAQALLVLGLGGLVLVLIEAPHAGLTDPIVLAGAAVAAITGARGATRRHAGGLLPEGFFARPTVRATAGIALLHNFGGWGAVFVLTLYFQLERGWTAFETGVALLPMPATMALCSAVAGRLVRPLGARPLIAAGMAVGAIAVAALALVERLPAGAAAAAFAGLGFASGLSIPAMTAVMLVAVPAEHAGASGAVLSTARQLGTALGVAVIGAVAAAGSGLAPALALAAAALAAGSLLALAYVRRLGAMPRMPEPVRAGAPDAAVS